MALVRLRTFLLVLAALVLQTAVLVKVRPAGVVPDVMVLVAIAGGIVGGPERGAYVGFGTGVAIDLFLQTPLGLSALAFSLVGYGSGLLGEGTVRAAWWIPVGTAMAGSVASVVVFSLAAAVVGHPELLAPRLALVAAVVALVNAVLAPVAVRLMRWARGATDERTQAVVAA